jgi:hypothetical protein
MFAGGWKHTVLRSGGPRALAALPEPVPLWLPSGMLLLELCTVVNMEIIKAINRVVSA